MNIKMLEIRDRATYIPVMAIKMVSEDPRERHHLRALGYGDGDPLIVLVMLGGPEAEYDPYKWGDRRTMLNAHQYIEEHYAELENCAVVDVEYILGEVSAPKESEFNPVDLQEMLKNIMGF